jgi:hypothetical protein
MTQQISYKNMTSHIQKCHIVVGGRGFHGIFVCAVYSHLCLTFSEYCV